jgi:hypothetical protein
MRVFTIEAIHRRCWKMTAVSCENMRLYHATLLDGVTLAAPFNFGWNRTFLEDRVDAGTIVRAAARLSASKK